MSFEFLALDLGIYKMSGYYLAVLIFKLCVLRGNEVWKHFINHQVLYKSSKCDTWYISPSVKPEKIVSMILKHMVKLLSYPDRLTEVRSLEHGNSRKSNKLLSLPTPPPLVLGHTKSFFPHIIHS